MIVAVDGPVAAGKGTLARMLANHYGFAYLDTGSLYRASAVRLLRNSGDPGDEQAAARAAAAIEASDLEDPTLRDETVGIAASRIAAFGAVRAALLDYQRRFATKPPGTAPGAVLDGRDIGTVVCPDADAKIFVTASREERARRRHKELMDKGIDVALSKVLADLEDRDRRDADRDAAPLVAAADAYLLDTTNLDIDSAFQAARSYLDEKFARLRT